MTEVIHSASLIVFTVGILTSFAGTIFFGIQMWHRRRPKISVSDVLGNPFNICLQPRMLTEQGLVARRRYFLSMAGFALCMSVVILTVLVK